MEWKLSDKCILFALAIKIINSWHLIHRFTEKELQKRLIQMSTKY